MQEDYGRLYRKLYHEHWWWRCRETIVVRYLEALALAPGSRILDVGCGDGLLFPKLDVFGDVRGIEVDASLVSADGPNRGRIYTDALESPRYDGWEFELITALDVIEHIEDDQGAVDRMVELLGFGGRLLLTVPAFMLLWDEHDVINNHYRRYTAARLRHLLAQRLQIRELRYLFHFIYLPKMLIKLLNRAKKSKVQQHSIPAAWLNRLMIVLCTTEQRILHPLRIPFGTSLLVLAEKV